MIDSTRPDSFQVSDYLGVLQRKALTIIGLAVVGALAAAAYVVVAPKAYTATAAVYVTPNAASAAAVLSSKTTTVVNMDNEAAIVTSNSVATLAGRALHSTLTPYQLLQKVAVTVPPNTEVLRISCSAPSARAAAACAQAFANAYLTARQATAMAKIQAEIHADQTRELTLEARSVKLQDQISSLKNGSAQATVAHEELANIGTQLAPLRSAIAALGASNNYQAGYIITAAAAPGAPSSPRKILYLPSGLMAGLLIGFVLAFWTDRRDDSLHAAQDVERFLHIPVLFALAQRVPGLRTAILPPRSVTGREFTELARATAAALGDGDHVLLVTGASAGSGTSVVAANLAAALARIRAEVVLVCADQQGPISPALLGIRAGTGRGLAELIAGTATIAEVAQPCTVPRLSVITPGTDPDAVEDMQYYAGQRLMTALKQDARFVVIDAGTATTGGASGLAEFADGAIIVAEIGGTERREIADCATRLERIRTEVLGVAVLPAGGRTAKAATRSPGVRPEATAASRRQAEPKTADRGKRRAGPPLIQSAPPEKWAGSAAADEAARPGPLLQDFNRRAKHGQPAEDETPSEPRGAGQTWPLPRITMPAPDEPPGLRKASDQPAAHSTGDS